MRTIFEKEYETDDLKGLAGDIGQALDEDHNEEMLTLPSRDGIPNAIRGKFKVTIIWEDKL